MTIQLILSIFRNVICCNINPQIPNVKLILKYNLPIIPPIPKQYPDTLFFQNALIVYIISSALVTKETII